MTLKKLSYILSATAAFATLTLMVSGPSFATNEVIDPCITNPTEPGLHGLGCEYNAKLGQYESWGLLEDPCINNPNGSGLFGYGCAEDPDGGSMTSIATGWESRTTDTKT